MKFLSTIKKTLKKNFKAVAAGLVIGVAVVAAPTIKAGFYPVRPVFDYNKNPVNGSTCTSADADAGNRCGSMTGPVFNSFINTPSYGDERAFVDGRRSDQSVGSNVNIVRDVTEGSKQVVIRMYVHNNANQNTNASGLGVAKNTKVRVELPTNADDALRAVGSISADNAEAVYDTIDMSADRDFKVQYVPGSAKLLRGTSVTAVSDDIVAGGANIGNLKGCFDYAALIEITVNVVPEASTDLQVVKTVRKEGETEWKKEVNAKPGDKVQWQIGTKNIALDSINNVAVRDVLPPHVSLVPGTVKMKDQYGVHNQNDGPVFSNGGIALGTYGSGGATYIIFTTTVNGDFDSCKTRVRNVALARSDQTPEERDDADVVITKENCVEPDYACDLLKAQISEGRKTKFTASASATNGAVIKRYIYNFGDGTQEFTTDKNVVEHVYAKDGNYTARVKVEVEVNGETKVAESDKCATPVNFSTPPETPETPGTPGTPSSLPNTGPGAIVATFLAVTSLSSAIYYAIVRKFAGV